MKSLDTETYLIRPGLPAPKLVVGQATDEKGRPRLLYPAETRDLIIYHWLHQEPLGFFNAPYDLGVCCAQFPELIPVVFALLAKGLIVDAMTRQPLLDLGRGTLLKNREGQDIGGYSLATVSDKVLGLSLAKENTPRLTYARLDGVPHELWSDEDKAYALKDAARTDEVIDGQGQGDRNEDPGLWNLALEPRENRAAWALHLMSCWGPRTDPAMVNVVDAAVRAERAADIARFTEAGLYRGEGWCRREKNCKGTRPHKLLKKGDLVRVTMGGKEVEYPAQVDCWRPWLPSRVGSEDKGLLKALVTAAYKGEPPRTDKDGVSTNRDTLMESGDPLLMSYAETGETATEEKTYLDVIARGVFVPINVRYDNIKRTTRTGARNPNLQNMPRNGWVRYCFVPRQGFVWCSVDYPSLELVTLAQNLLWMFGASRLAEMLNSGADMHVALASRLLGITYEEGLKLHKAKDPRMKEMRQAAKPVNYGLSGGMGAEKLVVYCRQPSNGGVKFCRLEGLEHNADVYISEKMKRPVCRPCVDIASKFRAAYFEMLPEMTRYHRYVKGETEDPENALIEIWGPFTPCPTPEICGGEKHREPSLWVRGRRFTEAANIRFQGLGARAAKDAIWRTALASYVGWEEGNVPEDLRPDTTNPLYGSRQVVFTHDESITEIPECLGEKGVTAAAERHAKLFKDAINYWCPDIRCEPKPALMRRWFKAAEDVRDPAGNLVPWWPTGPVKGPTGEKFGSWAEAWPADAPAMAADLARMKR